MSSWFKKSKAKGEEPKKAEGVEEKHEDLLAFQEKPKAKARTDASPQSKGALASTASSSSAPMAVTAPVAASALAEEKHIAIPLQEIQKPKEYRSISWASGIGGSLPTEAVEEKTGKAKEAQQGFKKETEMKVKAELEAKEAEDEQRRRAEEEAENKAKEALKKARAEVESKPEHVQEEKHDDLPNAQSAKGKSHPDDVQAPMETLQLTYIGGSQVVPVQPPVLPDSVAAQKRAEEASMSILQEEKHTELPNVEQASPKGKRRSGETLLPTASLEEGNELPKVQEEKHMDLPVLERPKRKERRGGYSQQQDDEVVCSEGLEEKHEEPPHHEIQKPKERPRSAEPPSKPTRISLGCEKQLPVARRPKRRSRRSVHPHAESLPPKAGPRAQARRIYLRPQHLAPAMQPEVNVELDIQWTASKLNLVQRYAETLEPRPLTLKERYGGHMEVGMQEDLKPVRFVQRCDASTGQPIGHAWIARNVVALPPQIQVDEDVADHLQDTEGRNPGTAEEVGPWRRLRYADSRVASEELQFRYSLEGDSRIVVDEIAPGSFAQRIGVAPGFHLVSVNEDKFDFHSHLQEGTFLERKECKSILRLSTSDGPVSLEFIDPLSGGHGVRSRGDIMARQSPPQPLVSPQMPCPLPIPGCIY